MGENGNNNNGQPGGENPSGEVKTALANIDKNTLQFGEEIKKMIATAGTLELNKQQKLALYAPVKDSDVYIKPDGLIYLSWIKYAERLTKAFGGTGWTMVPEGMPRYNGTSLIVWGFHLVIKGVYCGVAFGEQKYTKDMSFMSYGEACEGAKSNALMRLCKALGIGLELWDKNFIDQWLSKYAEWYLDNDKKKKWKLKKDAFGKTPEKPKESATKGEEKEATTKGHFAPGATIVNERTNQIFFYVFSSDDHIIAEDQKSYRLATEDEKKFYERTRGSHRVIRLLQPAEFSMPQQPELIVQKKSQAEGRIERKGATTVAVQEIIPLEEIKDEEATAVQPPAQPPAAVQPSVANTNTSRVTEDIKKIQATTIQKDLTKVFSDIKKKYTPEKYTPVEIETLRIAANQHFVKLGAKNIGQRR